MQQLVETVEYLIKINTLTFTPFHILKRGDFFMFVVTRKDVIFYGMMIFIIIVTLVIPTSFLKQNLLDVTSETLLEKIIIIDAGHGEPDGGAISNDGVKESTINLQIAHKVAKKLKENNIKVIMTREDENNIASESAQ